MVESRDLRHDSPNSTSGQLAKSTAYEAKVAEVRRTGESYVWYTDKYWIDDLLLSGDYHNTWVTDGGKLITDAIYSPGIEINNSRKWTINFDSWYWERNGGTPYQNWELSESHTVETKLDSGGTMYDADFVRLEIDLITNLLPVDITLTNETISGTDIIAAINSISAGTGVTITSTGDAVFQAGKSIVLKPGFHATSGSKFRAFIDPTLVPSPPQAPTGLVITNAGNNGAAPMLWWNASLGADSYKVYRKYAYSAYSLIDSTNINNYTDVEAELNSYAIFSISYYVIARNTGGESGASNTASALGSLPKEQDGIPAAYALRHAYPNPFNPTTTIRYELPEPAEVRLVVYNLLGREVVWLVDASTEPGYHTAIWHGRDATGRPMPSGLYIARLVTPAFTKSIKMVLLK